MKKAISLLSALAISSSMMVSFAVSTQAADPVDSEIKATYSLTFSGYTTAGTTTKSYFPTFDVWVEFPFELEKYMAIEPDYEETFEYVYQGKMIQTMGCDIDLGNGYATFIPTGKTVANTAEVPKCKVSKNTTTSKIQVTADSGSDAYDTYYAGSPKVKLATIAYRTTDPKATNTVTLTTGSATIATIDTTTGAMTPDIVAMSSGKIKLGDALQIPSYEEWSAPATVPATAIKLDKTELALDLNGEKTGKITATVEPTNTTDKVVWESKDKTIATVDENGNVTAVAEGKTTITATIGALDPVACTVTVKDTTPPEKPIVDVTPSKITGDYGTKTLKYIAKIVKNADATSYIKVTKTLGENTESKTTTQTIAQLLGGEANDGALITADVAIGVLTADTDAVFSFGLVK